MWSYWKNPDATAHEDDRWVVGTIHTPYSNEGLGIDTDGFFRDQEEAARRVNYLNGGRGKRYPL